MSKVLRTAAVIVGGIALVATGIGIAAGAGLFGSSLGAAGIGAAAAGVAKVAGFAAAGLSLAGALTAEKPKFDQASIGAEWRADPYAGLPYAMGETAVGGMIVMRRTDDAWAGGDENDLQTVVSVLSCAGPVESLLGVDIDRVATSFNPSTGAASGALADYLWWKGQLGATPEAAQLNIAAGSSSAPSGWTSAHKLSGLAADMVRMRYDSKGEKFSQGEPEKRVRGRWVKVYDPRLDSTYPGGSGSCRPFVETTYVWSRNPHLHALTWAMGRYANGKLICGLGAPLGNIVVDEFIEGANICDANGWHCDGIVFTRPQSAWNNLKLMLATGGAVPYTNGGRVGCRNQIPRVAVGSITSADLRGEASGPVTRPRRERKNIGFYRYRSPAHEYDLIDAGAPVRIASYITADGGEERPITEEWPLVQDEDQAAALTAYRIAETREAEPITFLLGPRFHAFKPGDCLTDDTPEGGGRLLRIEKRSVDAEAATVTLICRTETTAKHGVALGVVGQAPPVITPPAVPGAPAAPGVAAWAVAGTAISDTGGAIPALVITGAVDNPAATEILFWYRPNGATIWRAAGSATPNATRHEITAVTPGTSYEAAVSYRVRGILGARRVLGPVTAGVPVMDFSNVAGPTRPQNNANLTAPNGANLITLSRYEGGRGWIAAGSGLSAVDPILAGEPDGISVVQVTGTATASAQNLGLGPEVEVAGQPGDRFSISGYVEAYAITGAAPASWQFFVEYMNGVTVVDFDNVATGTGNRVRAYYEAFVEMPAGATAIRVRLRVESGGAAQLLGSLGDLMLARAAPGQTLHPRYSHGPNAVDGADPTRAVAPDLGGGNWVSGVFIRQGTMIFDANALWSARIDHTSSSGNRPGVDGTTWRVFNPSQDTGNPGTSASIGFNTGIISSTSYGSSYGTIAVKAGSGGVVDLGISSTVSLETGSSATAAMKVQRETTPGTWVDVSTEATSATVTDTTFETRVADFALSRQATGLTAGTSYNFRVLARRASGAGGTEVLIDGILSGAGR